MKLLSPSLSGFDRFHSHTNKPLRVHMEGVLAGTLFRSAPFTCARIAEVAALFHDLGKLNPNFQPKVNPDFQPDGKVTNCEYSRHAYLSAYAFLCFCVRNDAQKTLGLKMFDVWRVLALIARHHGHLPDFTELLNKDECDETLSFVASQPPLPVSEYLQQWLPHNKFDVFDNTYRRFFEAPQFRKLEREQREHSIADRLTYFQETQFAFASLIEADKRDAGDNKYFRRSDQIVWAKENFQSRLENYFAMLQESEKAEKPLNKVRTKIRNDAVAELQKQIETGARIFSLTAPTGAGKTYTLLALADVIRVHAPEHSIIYGLPFLTITEQVEAECREIFLDEFVTRFDSRTNNKKLEELLSQLDSSPQGEHSEKLRELLQEAFSSETFDAAFTVTTFVQIFETLLSNRNATLLKLPNFSKTIFLLDEIQALPPRLYVFFAAYLQAFCEKFDSYAIFSTATMPMFQIAEAATEAQNLFHEYVPPKELLPQKYFEDTVFNRYEVRPLQKTPLSREELAQKISEKNTSSLIVLNTIADSREIYNLLSDVADAEVILLNTHFTLRNRQTKIERCKELLKKKQQVILVSTQLIEAGVDIDFPMVFRDLCILPSLIQTAGRCNRNGEKNYGCVWLFELNENGKSRAELIYKSEPRWFLDFVREEVLQTDGFVESDSLPIQQKYFQKTCHDLKLGQHRLKINDSWCDDANLVDQIDALAFEAVGSFQLIDQKYGESLRYFVPQEEDEVEDRFEKLQSLVHEATKAIQKPGRRLPYEIARQHSIAIQVQLRRLAPDIVQFHVPYEKTPPAFIHECCGLRRLALPTDYSCKTGIVFDGESIAIL